MTLTLGGVTISSDNDQVAPIRWNKDEMETGEVWLSLGAQADLKARGNAYDAVFVVYDSSHPNGLVWGTTKILVKAEVEVKTG
jgi:hypothetical protein